MATGADDMDSNDPDLERLLSEPWKPVKYLSDDEDASENSEPLPEQMSPVEGQQLSNLFETNMNAIQNDMLIVQSNRKNILETVNSLDDEDLLSKFMTYEDPADHLKTVDTANIINAKEISTDLERLSHFRQRHSISAESTPSEIESQVSNESSRKDPDDEIDKLLGLMPDVITDDLVDDENDSNDLTNEEINNDVADTSTDNATSADAYGASNYQFSWNNKQDSDVINLPDVPDSVPEEEVTDNDVSAFVTSDTATIENGVVEEVDNCEEEAAETRSCTSDALLSQLETLACTTPVPTSQAPPNTCSGEEQATLSEVNREAESNASNDLQSAETDAVEDGNITPIPNPIGENRDETLSEETSAVYTVAVSLTTDVSQPAEEEVISSQPAQTDPNDPSLEEMPSTVATNVEMTHICPEDATRLRATSGTSTASVALSGGSFSSANSDLMPDASSMRDLPMSVAPPPFSEATSTGNNTLGYTAPLWVPDWQGVECKTCQGRFTMVRRRHHCRACGEIFCKNCCNMRFPLHHLQYKQARVCQPCYEILSRESGSIPERSAGDTTTRGSPPPDYSEAAGNSGHGNQAIPPPALDRFGQPVYPPYHNHGLMPPQANSLPQPSYDRAVGPEASVASIVPRRAPSPEYTALGRPRQSRIRTESEMSAVIMFNSTQTNLPPVMRNVDGVLKIINNPDVTSLMLQMQDVEEQPVVFLVNKNLIVKVKIVELDCCIKKKCWSFSTDGMGASNQEEIALALEYTEDDTTLLKKILQQINAIFERAKQGEPVSELSYMTFDEYMCLDPMFPSFLFFKRTTQCIEKLLLPQSPHLFALLLHKSEIPWARNFPLRLLLRYGAETSCCPTPLANVSHREPFYAEIGRTIIELLADFTNFQYTLPRIPGVIIMMKSKDLTVKLPQGRYDEVAKAFSMEDNIVSLAGSYSTRCDAFLICNQIDGNYKTQVLSMTGQAKKVTGACFIIFSAALKVDEGQPEAKANVVEDGIMIQVTAELMTKIRSAIKESNDIKVPCSKRYSEDIGKLKIQWTTSDTNESARPCSPIDGTPFSSLTNMKIRHSYDYTTNSLLAKIHWMEVYFLPNDNDTLRRLSARELGQLTSSVAKACMSALSPHLSTLIALEMSKIGLRVNLDSEVVEYKIGANQQSLPPELSGDLDDKLIPAIHSVITTLPQGRVAVELIFLVVQIV